MTKEILAAPGGFVPLRRDQVAADGSSPRVAAFVDGTHRNEPRFAGVIPVSTIADVAYSLRHAGAAAGRIAILGATQGTNTSQIAIKLARALAQDSRVVLVGLASGDTAIRGISIEPSANGLAELARGVASFANVITKDRLSPLHLISSGLAPLDRIDMLSSPGMATNFDALARSYDHVVVDAGVMVGPEIERLAEMAPQAVLVAETLSSAATNSARERLLASGFGDVAVLAAARGGGLVETAAAA
jgi:Mrp family chromosome partitioning ATPase